MIDSKISETYREDIHLAASRFLGQVRDEGIVPFGQLGLPLGLVEMIELQGFLIPAKVLSGGRKSPVWYMEARAIRTSRARASTNAKRCYAARHRGSAFREP